MKVHLPSGKFAKVGFKYGNERPAQYPPLPEKLKFAPWRSVRVCVTVYANDQEDGSLGTLHGISYCRPTDQFTKADGRKYAMRRIFDANRKLRLLNVEDCRAIAPLLLHGRKCCEN